MKEEYVYSSIGLQHDGSNRVFNSFTKLGPLQYSEVVSVKKDDVEITTLAQIDYKTAELNKVKLDRSSAIAAARAILKHFNATLESDQ